MSVTEESERGEAASIPRKPYAPPAIETEQIIEKQLMVICYTIDEGCEQDPPQS